MQKAHLKNKTQMQKATLYSKIIEVLFFSEIASEDGFLNPKTLKQQ